MFKQQASMRSVHPYQTTVVPRSESEFTSATQQRTKFPWAQDAHAPTYFTTTDSSTSDTAYHFPEYTNGSRRDFDPASPVYQAPYDSGTWRSSKYRRGATMSRAGYSDVYTFPECASAFSLPLCDLDPRLQTPARSPPPPVPSVSPEVPIIGACGGHCPGFEYVCYYILQVIFVVGILTGISLCIAGIVLRRTNRNGDLGVLVYIGCLMSCVCGVLLGVQCCVRREIRERKLRANMHIPLQSMPDTVAAPACPLLTSTLPRSQVYRSSTVPHPDGARPSPPWNSRAY